MKVTKENIGEILQHIYDSEIHLKLGWLWDAGVDYSFEPFWNDEHTKKEQHTGEGDLIKAFNWIVKDILEQYPNSSFSKWWKNDDLTRL